MTPKILLLDVETFPNLAFVWGKYQQDVIRFKQESCIASFSAKWLGKKVFSKSLPDYKGYKPLSYDDRELVHDIAELLEQADIVVAHNGDSFDFRVINARLIAHDHVPPAPYKTVDTKKVAKRVARFNSNRLDDLGVLLNIGKKIKTDFDLWEGCINGNLDSWRRMVRYNERDVILLEKLYLRLRPWMKTHPNFTRNHVCPKCGSKHLQSRGYAVTTTRKYQRFQCQGCGGWSRSLKSEGGSVVTNL